MPAELGEPQGRGLRGANMVGRGQCPSPTCSSEASYFKEHRTQRRGPASLLSPGKYHWAVVAADVLEEEAAPG